MGGEPVVGGERVGRGKQAEGRSAGTALPDPLRQVDTAGSTPAWSYFWPWCAELWPLVLPRNCGLCRAPARDVLGVQEDPELTTVVATL